MPRRRCWSERGLNRRILTGDFRREYVRGGGKSYEESLFDRRDSIRSCFGNGSTCGEGVRQRLLRGLFRLLLVRDAVIVFSNLKGLPDFGRPFAGK
jgi:hypothetical protein